MTGRRCHRWGCSCAHLIIQQRDAECVVEIGEVAAQSIGHDHRWGPLKGLPQLLGCADMLGVGDGAPGSPAACVGSCRLAFAADAHVIQVRGNIDETVDEPWIHRVVIACHTHVIVPARPNPLEGADLRWDWWQWCHHRRTCQMICVRGVA